MSKSPVAIIFDTSGLPIAVADGGQQNGAAPASGLLLAGSDGALARLLSLDTTGAVKLAAGTNAIGKLSENSGVVIGEVELAAGSTLATVTSVAAVTRLNQWNGNAISTNTGVRDAGTLRVTIATDDSVPVTFSAGPTSAAKAEDAASANGDVGIPSMAVRKATPANTSGTDGDYEFLQMSAGRLWTSTTVTGSVSTSNTNVDGDPGVGLLAVVGGFDGVNDQTLAVDSTGAVKLAAGTNSIGNIETVQEVVGLLEWNGNTISTNTGVRDAGTLRVTVATNDLVPVSLAAGATSVAKAEDSASADADVGIPAMAVRRATPVNSSGTDGDYEFLQMSAGRLWVSATITGSVVTSANNINVDGDPGVGFLAVVGGFDGVNDQTLAVDSTGAVKLAAGSNYIGNITTVNEVTSLAEWNGNSISTNTGVRNAGTLRVTIATDDIVPVTFSAGPTTVAKAEDSASADADVGIPAMAVRRAAPANSSGTDGDYEFLQMSAGRLWVSATISNTVSISGSVNTDIGTTYTNTDGDTSIGKMVIIGGTDGTNDQVFALDTTGAVKLAAGTNGIGKLTANAGVTIGAVEIAAAQTLATVSTVTSVSAVTRLNQWNANTISTNTGVRDAGTLRVTIATDDLVPVSLAAGATSVAKAEDAASADGDVGIPAMAVRRATPVNSSGLDGDYEFLQMSAGRLWVSATITNSVSTSANNINVDGDPDVGFLAVVGGFDGTNNQSLAVDSTGAVKLAAGSNYIGNITTVNEVTSLVEWNGNTISTNTGVRDAGTLRVTVATNDTVPISVATGATSIAKAEDDASANGDVGIPMLAVRKAAPANTSGTDGDYEFVQMSAGRLWCSSTVSGTVSISGSVDTDIGTSYANTDGGVSVGRLLIVGGTDGTNDQVLAVDTTGAVKLAAGTNGIGKLTANSGVDIGDVDVTSIIPGTGATNLGKAEDAVHASGDVGVYILAVRQDTPTASGANGDYVSFAVDSESRQWVRPAPSVIRLQVTPTISNGAIYANGDVIGGIQTLTNAARKSGGSGTVLSITVLDKTQAQRSAMDLLFFDRTVTVAADNANVAMSDADMAFCLGVITIGPYNTAFPGTPLNSISTLYNVGLPYVLNGTDLFVVVVSRGTPTYTSTSDLIFSYTLLQD